MGPPVRPLVSPSRHRVKRKCPRHSDGHRTEDLPFDVTEEIITFA